MFAKEANDFVKRGSDVQAFDNTGRVFKGFTCLCTIAPAVKADPDLMFAKCQVQQGSTPKVIKLKQISPPDDTLFDAKPEQCYNDNGSVDPMKNHDLGGLNHTNCFAALDYMRHRFLKGNIFCTADPLLVTLNPFKDLKNATPEIIAKYYRGDVTKMPVHVFTIAKEASTSLVGVLKSQSIIVSGESGAGKTEATKQVMRYLAHSKAGNTDTRIQDAIMAANPVLEAFGNAKTLRNDNSSRFGRFMKLFLKNGGGIEFGLVTGFLLEKSRVVAQGDGERNYHIFYELIKGCTEDEKKRSQIKTLKDYKCINPATEHVPTWDDVGEMKDVRSSFQKMGLSKEQGSRIMDIVSGCMLASNFVVKGDDTADISGSIDILKACADLWKVDFDSLKEGMTVKYTRAGGETVAGTFTREGTIVLMESLSKAMYEKTFLWIMTKLNEQIHCPDEARPFMGMLDIFGFEVFKNNSLEQLFINITNEFLQKNFVDVVFKKENELYKREGVAIKELTYTSNDPIIAVLMGKGGLMQALEDQCMAPAGDDKRFLSQAYSTCASNPRLKKAKINPGENFVVAHVIGDIQYNVTGFLRKNMDILRGEFVEVLQASKDEVTADLFRDVPVVKGGLPKGQLIGSQYITQLDQMMTVINSTECHFIRCVKTNEEKKPLAFTPSKVLVQLYALSVFEALQLRTLGYAYRRPFEDFLFEFRFINMEAYNDKRTDARERCTALLKSAGMKADNETVGIGKTMVFLKKERSIELSRKVREALAVWEPVVGCIEAMYLRQLRVKDINKYSESITRLQAHARRLIEVRQLAN